MSPRIVCYDWSRCSPFSGYFIYGNKPTPMNTNCNRLSSSLTASACHIYWLLRADPITESGIVREKEPTMKMRTFLQNKLWRDKLIPLAEEQGSIFHMQLLNDEEYDEQLRVKLAEEAAEAGEAQSHADLIEELGDIFEVIHALCILHGFNHAEIIAAQKKKAEARGGFAGRKFVIKVEHPEGSYLANYCLERPDKYPEVKL